MGYRSQVRSLIYGPKEKIDEFLFTHTTIITNIALTDHGLKGALSRYTVSVEKLNTTSQEVEETIYHVIDLSGDAFKWYETYEDVQAWDELLKEAEDFGLKTEFIRIGEDSGDVDVRRSDSNCGLIETSTAIHDNIERLEKVPLGF